MTVVIGLDSGRIDVVGLPACRDSSPRPHQAGGELIVVVPKGSASLSRLGEGPEAPVRLATSLGLAADVLFVCTRCAIHRMHRTPRPFPAGRGVLFCLRRARPATGVLPGHRGWSFHEQSPYTCEEACA